MNVPRLNIDLHGSDAAMTAAAVNVNTSGDNTLVTGISGTVIRLYRLLLVPSAALTITIKDGSSTVLLGPMAIGANQILKLSFDSQPWAVTSMGNNLIINLSAGTQTGGASFYTQG
jgi:hypothetical protein